MKKRVITWQVLILAAVFSLGAKNEQTPVLQKPAKPAGSAADIGGAVENYKKLRQEAQLIIENILKAMNEQNHAHYIRDFNIPMKAAYSKDVFKKNLSVLRGRIGKYVSVTPVKIDQVKQRFVFYYNAKFTKARGPVTVRLVLERNDNKLQVCFLSFDAPELKDPGVKK
jgi:hypothetical protein